MQEKRELFSIKQNKISFFQLFLVLKMKWKREFGYFLHNFLLFRKGEWHFANIPFFRKNFVVSLLFWCLLPSFFLLAVLHYR